MSSRNKRDNNELMRAYTLLGQRISRMDPLLAKTSCMNPELRETIGNIECYHTLFNCKDFEAEEKALMNLARVTWPRKELTDLALRVGDNVVVAEFEEVGDANGEDENIV